MKRKDKNTTEVRDKMEITLSNLRPYTTYRIKIIACNEKVICHVFCHVFCLCHVMRHVLCTLLFWKYSRLLLAVYDTLIQYKYWRDLWYAWNLECFHSITLAASISRSVLYWEVKSKTPKHFIVLLKYINLSALKLFPISLNVYPWCVIIYVFTVRCCSVLCKYVSYL